jgi:hypothetical protein
VSGSFQKLLQKFLIHIHVLYLKQDINKANYFLESLAYQVMKIDNHFFPFKRLIIFAILELIHFILYKYFLYFLFRKN